MGHNEDKYLTMFENLQSRLTSLGFIVVLNATSLPGGETDLGIVDFLNPLTNQTEKRIYDKKMGMYQQFPRVGSLEVYYKGHAVFSKLTTNNWPVIDMVVRRAELVHRNIQRGKSWNAGLMLITKAGGMYRGQLKSQYGLDSSFSGISALSNSNSTSANNRRFASQNNSQNQRRPLIKKEPRLQAASHASEQGPEAKGGRKLGVFKPSNVFPHKYVSNTSLNSLERKGAPLEAKSDGTKMSSDRALLPANINTANRLNENSAGKEEQ